MNRHAAFAVVCAGLALVPRGGEAQQSPRGLRTSLGPANAPHAMPGVDSQRSRRSSAVLSRAPRVEGRFRLAYGIGRGLVTRTDGGFFVLHQGPRASSYDVHGKLLYSLKLAAEPTSAPVMTSDAAIAFVVAGELVMVDAYGQVRARVALGDPDFNARSILSLQDGSVALASSSALLKVSAFGELVWRRSLSETPLELLETQAGLVCVSALGSVYRVDGAGRLNKLGDLGGPVQAVTASRGGHALLARSGSHRLVMFDLDQRRAKGLVEELALELDGPVLVGEGELAQAFTIDGLLPRYQADGSEAQRVPFDPGARRAPAPDEALQLGDGRLLIARAGADVAVVTPAGEVATVAGSGCPDPVGLFAAGPQAVLFACRSGNMLRLE